MNQPEGYVLVQIKQLAQWREWANNVAAWSKQADRSSEVARLKASISSAMISATLPPASAAGERERFEAAMIADGFDAEEWLKRDQQGGYYESEEMDAIWRGWQARAALATKPQAVQEATPPAQTVQDSAYPSDVEIAVPPIGSEWGHTNGDTYTVTGYADMFSDSHQRRPPRIIYRSAKTGRVWSREHSDWHRAMKPLADRTRGDEAGKS